MVALEGELSEVGKGKKRPLLKYKENTLWSHFFNSITSDNRYSVYYQ
jgi:hypothetical protein